VSAHALPPDALCRHCDPRDLPFETTAEAPDRHDFLGQDRALEAAHFGISVRRDGYNLFAMGPAGVGKQSALLRLLHREAADQAPAEDWCYVYNFVEPRRPRALRLPAGRARELRADMERAVAEVRVALRAAFEGEEYRTRKQRLIRELEDRQNKAFRDIERHGKEMGVSIARAEDLFTVTPLRAGVALQPGQFDELDEEEQARFQEQIARAEDALGVMLQEFNDWGRQHREALEAQERSTAAAVGSRIFGQLRLRYSDQPDVSTYLSDVEADLATSAAEFTSSGDPADEKTEQHASRLHADDTTFELRASVNVLIEHDVGRGVPVVYENHPTYTNLMGRMEHAARFGSLIADFSLIKSGAMHRAREGYLLIDAHRLLENPVTWEALKRALRSREIRVESPAQQLDATPTISLDPEPIPLANTKIVLLGERELYDLLAEEDPDFLELFKVLVDFDDCMERQPPSESRYAQLIAWLARKDELRDFSRDGVARIIDHAARLASDAGKLTVRMRPMLDLMREADARAGMAGASLVTRAHVEAAVDAQRQRAGRLRARIQEDVRHGVTLLDSAGAKVGQINALSVVASGEQVFGLTVRVTARAWIGKGHVIDIEREVELGGPLHSKGVLILTGFLGARHATSRPLSLTASLVFEQSYAIVEGDSASLAEACALLSALSDMPIKQSIAVTGSMNQHGDVQAIGGVNEKIEGFFDVCSERGLTGAEGVLIPSSNARHLMLRPEVVAAARAGKFHVHGVDTIDDAIEILFGREAGRRDERGNYPAGSVNAAVEARLHQFAESSRSFQSEDWRRGRD
jgi:lon-related putative ATP-dependent protease